MAFTHHASCFYQVHKSCSYRLFSLQELKQNDLRTSLELYGTMLAEPQLEEEYNYNILLRMNS